LELSIPEESAVRRTPVRQFRCTFRLVGASGVLLLALAAARASAQEGTPPDSAVRRHGTARRDSAQRLTAVTVTALRTPFALERAPYAVTVLGGTELQGGRPGFNLAEALVAVPGVQVDNRYNYALGERISVRGFGARAQFGVRGVRVLIDGIPATMPDGQTTLNHVDVAELGRAEIVRGPASAIYGNASGGVLQLESEVPPPVPVAGRLRATGGGDGLRRLQGTVGGQQESGRVPLAYTLNVSDLRYDGYRDWQDARNSYAAMNVRAGGSRTSVRLTGHLADYAGHNPGALSASLLAADRSKAFRDNQLRWRAGEDGRHRQVGAEARHQMGSGELRLTGYVLGREVDNPIPQRIVALDRRAGGVRLAYAARADVAGLPVQVVVGTEAERQRDDRQNFVNDTGRRGDLSLNQLEHVTATAGFAQVAVAATSRLSVLGALRYDRTRFAVRDRYVTGTDPDDSGERTMRAASPSVGVSWSLGRDASLYANYATAFETPTTTELANRPSGAGGFNPDLQPQRTRSVEAGGTTRLGRLGFAQLALYRARVSDALIPFEVPGAAGRQFFRNAGSAIHRGAELGAVMGAARGLSARAAYTFTDAKFDRYTVAGASYAGKRVPGIAPHRADLSLLYDLARGGLVAVDERYVSAVPTNDANATGSDAGAYALTNVRVEAPRLRALAAGLSPFAGVTNVFDRPYVTSVVVNAFGARYYEPGPGRTVYVGVELGAQRSPAASRKAR
jgi:iron complex outermembrane receptor protein